MSGDRAVLLYGSYARGDADAHSDVDVLVVGPTTVAAAEIAPLLPVFCQGPVHISHYTWAELEAMSNYGSLFLHHVATEASGLQYEGDARAGLSALLMSLGPYQLAKRDLIGFRATVCDVEAGLQAGLPPCFELAVLGGVARHASVLGCYVAGKPTFGRHSIARAAALLHLGAARDDLEMAHRFRLFEAGQCDVPKKVSRAVVQRVVSIVSVFLDRLELIVHANTTELSAPDRRGESLR